MADLERELLEVVDRIYVTVADPGGWIEVLQRLSSLLGATVGTLDLYDVTLRSGDIAAAFNLDPDFCRIYREQAAGKNLWVNSRRAWELPAGTVLTGQMLVSDETLEKSEFYQEYLRSQNIFHLIGSRLLEEKLFTANLTLLRPKSKGSFGTSQIDIMECLMPHLLRAIQMQSRLADVIEREKASNEALDLLPFGVILVTSSGKPVLVNKIASEIAATRDGLILRRELVTASSPSEGAALLRLISKASAAYEKVGPHPGGALRFSRPSLKPALVVLVAPLAPRRHFLATEGASAILFITDPMTSPTNACEVVAFLFGLTPAETRLCRLLASGQSLAEAARKLGVSMNTVRTQSKRIFSKTGTRSQADLVLLLTKGVPNVRDV